MSDTVEPAKRLPYPQDLYPGCPCYACDSKTWPGWRNGMSAPFPVRMSLCPNCGNKRCPAAFDHTQQCSGSNEPGQRGSLYE